MVWHLGTDLLGWYIVWDTGTKYVFLYLLNSIFCTYLAWCDPDDHTLVSMFNLPSG